MVSGLVGDGEPVHKLVKDLEAGRKWRLIDGGHNVQIVEGLARVLEQIVDVGSIGLAAIKDVNLILFRKF